MSEPARACMTACFCSCITVTSFNIFPSFTTPSCPCMYVCIYVCMFVCICTVCMYVCIKLYVYIVVSVCTVCSLLRVCTVVVVLVVVVMYICTVCIYSWLAPCWSTGPERCQCRQWYSGISSSTCPGLEARCRWGCRPPPHSSSSNCQALSGRGWSSSRRSWWDTRGTLLFGGGKWW